MSADVSLTEKGSKATAKFDLKDSLVLGYPKALGGNSFNLSFGIAKKLGERVLKSEFRALI